MTQHKDETVVTSLLDADALEVKNIEWLWNGWLAKGKLHLLAGATGTAKTTLAIQMAAIVSSGGQWPDGTSCPQGRVLIWSGEDDINDTLLPRLIAAGANLKMVNFVGSVYDEVGRRSFDPATDLESLKRTLDLEKGFSLIIVDPIVSAVNGDSHKNAEVRRGLQPIVNLAAEKNAALIGITHLTKGTQGKTPSERVTGSLAFAALARIVFLTAKVKDSKTERVFCRAKSNIGLDYGGYTYHTQMTPIRIDMEASVVVFDESFDDDALDRMNASEGSGQDKLEPDVEGWLKDVMANGERPASEIWEEAESEGYLRNWVLNAKNSLNIKAKKLGNGPGRKPMWVWVP